MSTTTNFAHSEFTFHGDSAYLMSLTGVTEASFSDSTLDDREYQGITDNKLFHAEKDRQDICDDEL